MYKNTTTTKQVHTIEKCIFMVYSQFQIVAHQRHLYVQLNELNIFLSFTVIFGPIASTVLMFDYHLGDFLN